MIEALTPTAYTTQPPPPLANLLHSITLPPASGKGIAPETQAGGEWQKNKNKKTTAFSSKC